MGKSVVRNTNTGVKFGLKAGSGQVIATLEGDGLESVKKNVAIKNAG